MKKADIKQAFKATKKCSKLMDDLARCMEVEGDCEAKIALYERLREAGYFFLGVAAEVKGDD